MVTHISMLLELIQVALGHRKCLSRQLTDREWMLVYEEAWKQSVAGICFSAVQRLPKEQRPPEDLYWQWLGDVAQIQEQNRLMDQRTAEVWQRLKQAGLDAVVLKGQGIAAMYDVRGKKDDVRGKKDDVRGKKDDVRGKKDDVNLGALRQSGDIDIWVKGGYRKVCEYVQKTCPTDDVAYHRFHYDCYEDTEVELHHRPTLMRNLFDDRKLARWYGSFGADSFVYLEDKGFAVPSVAFNRIFILTHIYRHFLFEGIGLRQIVDYYFVLRAQNEGRCQMEDVRKTLRELRLMRFAEALMWILHTQLGLEEQYLICGMNEKEGRFVLKEIAQTGNFGQGDKRYQRWRTWRRMTVHGAHLLTHYPSEVLWTPVWLVYHKVWKWNKKRIIRKSWK